MSIEDRVERLERLNERLQKQNRRMRGAFVFVGVCLTLVVGMAAVNDRIQGGLNIDSIQGQAQILLETHTDFGPAIRIIDQNGSERLRIGSSYRDGGDPFIEFYSQGPAPNQRGQLLKRIRSRD